MDEPKRTSGRDSSAFQIPIPLHLCLPCFQRTVDRRQPSDDATLWTRYSSGKSPQVSERRFTIQVPLLSHREYAKRCQEGLSLEVYVLGVVCIHLSQVSLRFVVIVILHFLSTIRTWRSVFLLCYSNVTKCNFLPTCCTILLWSPFMVSCVFPIALPGTIYIFWTI